MFKWIVNGAIALLLAFLLDLFNHHLSPDPSQTASFMSWPHSNNILSAISIQRQLSITTTRNISRLELRPRATGMSVVSPLLIMANDCRQCQGVAAASKSGSSLGENISVSRTHTQTHTHSRKQEPGCHIRRDKRHHCSVWQKNAAYCTSSLPSPQSEAR